MNYSLLVALSDGQFHSGARLAERFGVTRTTIWQHIDTLKKLGIDVYSLTGKGYKLASPLILLSHDHITSLLHEESRLEVLHVLPKVDSTNAYIKNTTTPVDKFSVALSEYQTQGRGRMGRQWQSPAAQNIYLSIKFRLPVPISQCQSLSLVMGLAVSEALNHFLGEQIVGVKWPNDLYVDDKKLGGILIELSGEMDTACDCIVGIGLNVNVPMQSLKMLDRPAVSLAHLFGQSVDRNIVAAALINQIISCLDRFFALGFDAFYEEWFKLDVMYGREVYILKGNKKIYGTCEGVNHDGELILNQSGRRETYNGGEVSLRNV